MEQLLVQAVKERHVKARLDHLNKYEPQHSAPHRHSPLPPSSSRSFRRCP